jgi:hypothetical protein
VLLEVQEDHGQNISGFQFGLMSSLLELRGRLQQSHIRLLLLMQRRKFDSKLMGSNSTVPLLRGYWLEMFVLKASVTMRLLEWIRREWEV